MAPCMVCFTRHGAYSASTNNRLYFRTHVEITSDTPALAQPELAGATLDSRVGSHGFAGGAGDPDVSLLAVA